MRQILLAAFVQLAAPLLLHVNLQVWLAGEETRERGVNLLEMKKSSETREAEINGLPVVLGGQLKPASCWAQEGE